MKKIQFLEDFKSFAIKGNVVDLAVWVIIGSAFGKIVSSLVADIVTPALGLVVGWVDFTKWSYVHRNLISGTEVTIRYGQFLQSVFDFLVIALSIFAFVSVMNRALRKEKKEAEKKKADEVVLLEEIRDLLARSDAKAPKPGKPRASKA